MALGLRALRRRLLRPRLDVPRRHVGGRSRGLAGGRDLDRRPRARVGRLRRALPRSRQRRMALGLGGVRVRRAVARGERASCFAARAAYIEVGAMLGTIMVGNVFFVIIPAHWELVRAKQEGREPDPRWNGLRGKQRSVHNNYLTLPVVFAMLVGPLPVHVRACARVADPRRADGDRRLDAALLQPPPRGPERVVDPRRALRSAIVALAVVIRPDESSQSTGGPAVSLAQVQSIVQQRVRAVPLAEPDAGPGSRPRRCGIRLDTRGGDRVAGRADQGAGRRLAAQCRSGT